MIMIDDIYAARDRIRDGVRVTPVMRAGCESNPLPVTGTVTFKLELAQVTGSFKARGALNRLRGASEPIGTAGIVTASGGNHGLAVARTAAIAGHAATIFVPETVSPAKVAKMREWRADVRIVGVDWANSNVAALAWAADTGAQYFHPFADPLVVAGQGTLGLELLEQVSDIDMLILAVGGGGLVSGVGTAIKALAPHVRIIAVEPTGSPTLRDSIAAGYAVRLPQVTSRVATMACPQTDDRIVRIAAQVIDGLILIEDEAMQDAAEWLWFEYGIAADLAGAASVAALRSGHPALATGRHICALICGAGPEGVTR